MSAIYIASNAAAHLSDNSEGHLRASERLMMQAAAGQHADPQQREESILRSKLTKLSRQMFSYQQVDHVDYVLHGGNTLLQQQIRGLISIESASEWTIPEANTPVWDQLFKLWRSAYVEATDQYDAQYPQPASGCLCFRSAKSNNRQYPWSRH